MRVAPAILLPAQSLLPSRRRAGSGHDCFCLRGRRARVRLKTAHTPARTPPWQAVLRTPRSTTGCEVFSRVTDEFDDSVSVLRRCTASERSEEHTSELQS